MGTQLCEPGGRFARCECSPPVDAGPTGDADCAPGTTRACDCADGPSVQTCLPEGGYGPCACEITPTCTGDAEWCNGRDDDCDAIADEGFPCPAPAPPPLLEGSISLWMNAYPAGGTGPTWLVEVFPGGAPPIPTPDLTASAAFTSTDAVLLPRGDSFYRIDGSGTTLEAFPCPAVIAMDVDGMNRIVAECIDGVYRDGVRVLDHPGARLVAVLGDGSFVAAAEPTHYALHDVRGAVVSELDLSGWVGELAIPYLVGGHLADGSALFVVGRRHSGRGEAVTVHASATSGLAVIRRTTLTGSWLDFGLVALPDGRVLRAPARWGREPSTAALEVYEVDGTVTTIAPPRAIAPTSRPPSSRGADEVLVHRGAAASGLHDQPPVDLHARRHGALRLCRWRLGISDLPVRSALGRLRLLADLRA